MEEINYRNTMSKTIKRFRRFQPTAVRFPNQGHLGKSTSSVKRFTFIMKYSISLRCSRSTWWENNDPGISQSRLATLILNSPELRFVHRAKQKVCENGFWLKSILIGVYSDFDWQFDVEGETAIYFRLEEKWVLKGKVGKRNRLVFYQFCFTRF